MSNSFKNPLHIRDLIGRNEGDWPTETEENGNYSIDCSCGRKCTGPKRALCCYVCYIEGKRIWNALTPEQQLERLKQTAQELEVILRGK